MKNYKTLIISMVTCIILFQTKKTNGQEITNIQPGQLPKATTTDMYHFEHLRRSQNGISGAYDSDLYLGSAINSNGRVLFGKKWFLWSYQPETFCGKMATFGGRKEKLFALLERGREMDWVLRMEPGIGFEHLIAHTYHKNLLSAEVTPDQSLMENPWFDLDNKQSSLLDQYTCACGDYAQDKEHSKYGPKMEIHPAHMVWWTDSSVVNTTTYQMMAIQDNSNRFTRGYFRPGMGHDLKKKVKSWVVSPLEAKFRIAFLLPPPSNTTAPINVTLKSQYQRGVNALENTSSQFTSDVLQIQGKTLIKVEKKDSPQNIAVRFTDLLIREDGSIQGFIELTTSIGQAGKYGNYHVFSASTDHSLIQESLPQEKCFEQAYLLWIRQKQVAELTGLVNATDAAIRTSHGKVKKALTKQSFLLNEKRKQMTKEALAQEDALLGCIEK